MSDSRHAAAPDQSRVPTRRTPAAPRPSYGAPAGYHALRLTGPPMFPATREQQRPPRDWISISLLDEEQVGDAAVAIRAALRDSIRLDRTPPRSGAGSGGYLRYPSVHSLEAALGPDVRLLDPKSMEEMAFGVA